MTRKELCRELRRAHRRRFGEVADWPDPADAAEVLDAAEAELGFPLPKLLRQVYTFAGPDFVDPDQMGDGHHPGDGWPAGMVVVKMLAGGDFLCVDCSAPTLTVWAFYDNWDSGEPYWPTMFEPVADSFEDFLAGFVDAPEFPASRADPEDPDGRPWTEYPDRGAT